VVALSSAVSSENRPAFEPFDRCFSTCSSEASPLSTKTTGRDGVV
jgi:hypothetical protein